MSLPHFSLPPDRKRNRYEPRPSIIRPFEFIIEYLSGDLSLAQAVDHVAEPVEDAHGTDDEWLQLINLWTAFNAIVEQIPHSHSAHLAMANLFVALRTRSTPPKLIEYHGDLWRDIPGWTPLTRPTWSSASMTVGALTARKVDRDADTLGSIGGAKALRERYMNTNAFLARLARLKDAPGSTEVYALSALRWAMETNVEPEAYDLDVPGAAMWMLYAGEHVFGSKREHIEQLEDVAGFERAEHPWWEDEERNGFCRERWDVWKSGFSEMEKMEELSEETKDLAKQAVEHMEKVESSHNNENSR